MTSTPADVAWKAADAAIAAAFDESVACAEVDLREEFPQVEAIYGALVDSDSGRSYAVFQAVLVNGAIRSNDQIKPENAEAIEEFLTKHLTYAGLCGPANEALRRATTSTGYWRALPAEVTP